MKSIKIKVIKKLTSSSPAATLSLLSPSPSFTCPSRQLPKTSSQRPEPRKRYPPPSSLLLKLKKTSSVPPSSLLHSLILLQNSQNISSVKTHLPLECFSTKMVAKAPPLASSPSSISFFNPLENLTVDAQYTSLSSLFFQLSLQEKEPPEISPASNKKPSPLPTSLSYAPHSTATKTPPPKKNLLYRCPILIGPPNHQPDSLAAIHESTSGSLRGLHLGRNNLQKKLRYNEPQMGDYKLVC